MLSLNVIGAGRVGKTLGLLFNRLQVARPQDVLCRTQTSADAAIACIGTGRAITSWNDLQTADLHLISVPDDALLEVVQKLADAVDLSGSVVFHTSGWRSSEDLAVATEKGAFVASVHPIKGFPEPASAADSFPGTWCAIEGDVEAVEVLRSAFEVIGAQLIPIDTEKKPLYHTATVMACNYMVALAALAQESLVACGIGPEKAMQMLIPLMRNTVDNLEQLGPVNALTGPVVRGDASTVGAHMGALLAWEPSVAHTYSDLANHLIDLAAKQGTSDELLKRVDEALRSAPSA